MTSNANPEALQVQMGEHGHSSAEVEVRTPKAIVGSVIGRWLHTSTAAYFVMWGLLILGIATAMSHHAFTAFLNTRAIEEAAVPQAWAIRIGTAFPYLFKTALTAAIGVAYWQVFWYMVRRKVFKIGSMDKFVAVLTNPFMFFCRDFVKKASPLFGLAVVVWLLPISAVFAPGTLTGSHPHRCKGC